MVLTALKDQRDQQVQMVLTANKDQPVNKE
jgi:hypothetical protein